MKHPKLKALALGSALALAYAGHALAESQYGFSSAGTGTVTATAKVNLSVVIPKLILLKVGSSNALQDTVTWTAALTIPPTPGTTPTATANNVQVPWDGTAPTVAVTPAGNVLAVSAWTNAGTANINCAVGAWSPATGGPPNANFTVVSAGATPVPHPGANLGACASTTLTPNTLLSGTWTYALTGTATAWSAGTYTGSVTYTATGV
ncbi:MAG: hypothetical protein LBE58_00920 [Comamonas sp.]|jgi:hypothetical protein|uniref:Ig-like domain-containing protein n=1 Tax=Comamonas koreensis TaxID=160825 RepID=A0AAW4XT50_9BURK|nr:hypothetical protein [Comamonas koreensis]MCD2163919.1 hypothetical protein [Comamonas koreensis]MDR2328139.1 hypothetical protein [Comamonas sp.]